MCPGYATVLVYNMDDRLIRNQMPAVGYVTGKVGHRYGTEEVGHG